jgi:tetratricopeptide (TPR) repeat protein
MNRKVIAAAVVLLTLLLMVSRGWGQTEDVEEAKRLQRQADQLYQQGNYTEAASLGERVLTILEKALGPDHPETATALSNLAEAYRSMGEYAKALPLYQRALVIVEKALGPDHPDTATTLNNLAEVYYNMGEYAQALLLCQRALAIREKVLGPDHPDTATTLSKLAAVYYRMDDYAKALPLYQRTLTICEKAFGSDHPYTATTLNNLAELYRDMGEYAQALPLHQRALAIREKVLGPDHPNTAESLSHLAEVYYNMGEYAQALLLCQRALAIREKVLDPDHPDTAHSFNALAMVYYSMGEYAKALPLYERALAIREKALGPNHPDTARSLNNLAVLYKDTGEYAQALPLYERALAIREKALGPNHPDTAQSLNNLAPLYDDIGDYTKALLLHQRALAIREKALGPNHPDTAQSLNNLAALYESMRDYTKALPLYQRALAIWEKGVGPDHPSTALALDNLARLYTFMGDYTQALPLSQRALAIREKVLGPDHPSTATTLGNLANLYVFMGEYTQALPLSQRALAIWEKALGPDHPETAPILSNLAMQSMLTGEYAQGLRFLQRALTAQDYTFANVFSVASEEQKLQFAEKSQGTYLFALLLIHRRFPKDPQAVRFSLELVLRRKGIVLDAQSRAQQTLAAHLEGKTLESWQRLTQYRSALSRSLLGGPGKQSPEDYKRRVEELHGAIAREEEFLAQHSGLVAQELTQRQVTAQMLAGRLPKDGVLAEFVRIQDLNEKTKQFDKRYLAFVLTPDNQVTLVDLGDAEKIDAKIKSTLAAINHPDYSRDPETYSRQADTELSALYTLLLQPLEAALGSYTRLIVSPDGELNNVPFAALRTPDSHYLVEKFTLSYVASGRDLLRGKTGVDPATTLLLVANPAFDDGKVLQMAAASSEEAVRAADYRKSFPSLPGTAEEARIIPPLVKGTQKVLEGKQATESAVRTTQSPKVLHLATHGFFLKDETLPLPDLAFRSSISLPTNARISPMVRSGLALAGANHAQEITTGDDGLLTALEVTSMNLYGTDLVVLSACETAAGDVKVGEGVYGLRRAFVLAGAKNLVMSLWQVGDQTTRTQMEEFYRAYGQGERPADALRRAQLQTLTNLRELTATMKEPLAPVRLWAPFIVQQTGE